MGHPVPNAERSAKTGFYARHATRVQTKNHGEVTNMMRNLKMTIKEDEAKIHDYLKAKIDALREGNKFWIRTLQEEADALGLSNKFARNHEIIARVRDFNNPVDANDVHSYITTLGIVSQNMDQITVLSEMLAELDSDNSDN
jgi:hypothetical protein